MHALICARAHYVLDIFLHHESDWIDFRIVCILQALDVSGLGPNLDALIFSRTYHHGPVEVKVNWIHGAGVPFENLYKFNYAIHFIIAPKFHSFIHASGHNFRVVSIEFGRKNGALMVCHTKCRTILWILLGVPNLKGSVGTATQDLLVVSTELNLPNFGGMSCQSFIYWIEHQVPYFNAGIARTTHEVNAVVAVIQVVNLLRVSKESSLEDDAVLVLTKEQDVSVFQAHSDLSVVLVHNQARGINLLGY